MLSRRHSNPVDLKMMWNLRERLAELWATVERVGDDRTVLVVTRSAAVQRDLRIASIRGRWRVVFVRTLDAARRVHAACRMSAVVCDREVMGVNWQPAARQLLDCGEPAFLILLASDADDSLWRSVLAIGGFAVARAPVVRSEIIALLNNAFSLSKAMNADGCHLVDSRR